MSDNTFKLQINFTKAYKGDDNVAYIEGIASGPEVDLTGERMSVDALRSMVESLKKRLVEFRDVHEEEWNSDLGEVVELSLTDDNHLFYKAKLNLNLSGARDLWYRITEQGKKLGVSVGGSVVKAGYEYVAELGRSIYTYVDVDLSHIGITRQAAYQHSFANAVLKSLSTKKEEPMSKSQQVEKTDELEQETAETQTDTNLTESEAAATDAAEDAQDATHDQADGEEVSQENSEEAAAEADAESESAEEAEPAEEDAEQSTDAEDESKAAEDESAEEEVAKSAVLGEWTEAGMTADAISTLSYRLQDFVFFTLMDEDKSADEKRELLDAALAEFHALTMKVVSALVAGNAEEVQRAADAFKANKPEAVAKSLTEKDTKVEELTKSLSAKTDELETVQKSLEEKETELEKFKAHKSLVFDKFGGHEADTETHEEVVKASNEKFASFIITGAR